MLLSTSTMWAKSFREVFCEQTGCTPEQYELHLLRRGLHRRSLPIALLILAFQQRYFDLELRTLRYLGNAQSSQEFRSELDSYRSQYRRHGGALRKIFAVRLSGGRLMRI